MPVSGRLALGDQHANLITCLKVGIVSHHEFDYWHIVARLEILGGVAERNFSVDKQTAIVSGASNLCADYRTRMHDEVSILLRSIITQRQRADAIRAGLDGTIVVYHAADAACTAQYTLAEDIGDGVCGISFSSQGSTKLL